MVAKLDIPISEVIISKQLDFRQTLDILHLISPALKDLPADKVSMEDIVHNSLFTSYGSEYPSLVVLAPQESGITSNDLFNALLAAQPILVLEENKKERFTEVTFHHRALMSQPEVFSRNTKYLPHGNQRDKSNLANTINAGIYLAAPSGQEFSFHTRTQHTFIRTTQ